MYLPYDMKFLPPYKQALRRTARAGTEGVSLERVDCIPLPAMVLVFSSHIPS